METTLFHLHLDSTTFQKQNQTKAHTGIRLMLLFASLPFIHLSSGNKKDRYSDPVAFWFWWGRRRCCPFNCVTFFVWWWSRCFTHNGYYLYSMIGLQSHLQPGSSPGCTCRLRWESQNPTARSYSWPSAKT